MYNKPHERIDDIQRNGYKLIQNPEAFCFGIDAVLLAHYAKVTKPQQQILDIGTGTGIIPILMHAIYQQGKYIGIDIKWGFTDTGGAGDQTSNPRINGQPTSSSEPQSPKEPNILKETRLKVTMLAALQGCSWCFELNANISILTCSQ